ncbi:RdgB/HAM1 family non-canonical purine NTP pyrophosphatase [Candidatus Uhrbacteria bacterium]|nr:RdgB/HAM1 family non-canonical purine NTP pyrophosphatase [Candidatus Uhrbacteria bacterium]
MHRLIFATHNQGKVKEMRALMERLGLEILSADEAGVHEDPTEDGATFEENALKKARFIVEQTGEWAVADDSGIMIDALDGRPGVHTARWAGENAGDEGLIRHALEELKGVEERRRGASFHSVVALVSPGGEAWAFEGVLSGRITVLPRGTPRPKLPYDLIFQPSGSDRTFAEMSDEEKNAMSHRGQAFQKLKTFLSSQRVVHS